MPFVNLNIHSAKYQSSIPFELIIAIDESEWYSLTWIPISRLWRVAVHTTNGWDKPQMIDMKKFEDIISTYQEKIPLAKLIQYRNNNTIKIYRVVKKKSKDSSLEKSPPNIRLRKDVFCK